MSLLSEFAFFLLNYDYLFDKDSQIQTLTSSLLDNAKVLGATITRTDYIHPSSDSDNEQSHNGQKVYILTPIKEKLSQDIPQRTIFWLIDVIVSGKILSIESPLHLPRDPNASEWNFLSNQIATISGYRGKERIYICSLLAAAGAKPEGDLHPSHTTLLISDAMEETEKVKMAKKFQIPIQSKEWLLAQFSAIDEWHATIQRHSTTIKATENRSPKIASTGLLSQDGHFKNNQESFSIGTPSIPTPDNNHSQGDKKYLTHILNGDEHLEFSTQSWETFNFIEETGPTEDLRRLMEPGKMETADSSIETDKMEIVDFFLETDKIEEIDFNKYLNLSLETEQTSIKQSEMTIVKSQEPNHLEVRGLDALEDHELISLENQVPNSSLTKTPLTELNLHKTKYSQEIKNCVNETGGAIQKMSPVSTPLIEYSQNIDDNPVPNPSKGNTSNTPSKAKRRTLNSPKTPKNSKTSPKNPSAASMETTPLSSKKANSSNRPTNRRISLGHLKKSPSTNTTRNHLSAIKPFQKEGNPCIAVTGFKLLPSELSSWESLGGSIATTNSAKDDLVLECTHLVASRISRTAKFLLAIARGLPIVSRDWILDSIALETMELDAESYALKDPSSELVFNLNLSESIKKAQNMKFEDKGIFSGMKFMIDPSLANHNFDLITKLIVECKGSVAIENLAENIDYTITSSTTKKNFSAKDGEIRDTEWLFQSILQQQIVNLSDAL